jgi:anti-sigma regulatory factor (Ser/Thr protein kinase)
MLAEINVSEKAWTNCLSDLTAPDFVTLDEAFLAVRGCTPDDFLSGLDAAFAARFASVPPEKLIRDLYYPLKKGLGNAYKWGNRKDPDKQITVEVVATKTGALVAIADDGEGFDVDGILRRFQGDGQYFSHGGSGFEHFNRAQSVISYADGGRTLLIRFLCVPRSSGGENVAAQNSAHGAAGDEAFMKSLFAAALPYFQANKTALESCRIYLPDDPGEMEIKYVLECRQEQSAEIKTVKLTGRLLPEAAAQKDFSVAAQLYKTQNSVHIPKPVAVFKEPSLGLFEFNPAKDLRDYLKKIEDFQEVAEIIKKIAAGLRALHHSAIDLPAEATLESALERYRAVKNKAVAMLAQTGPPRAERVQEIFNRLIARAAILKSFEPVPIHGSFGWENILYGESKFYFFRFEQCRRSHPGFDAGSFLAELRRFYLLRRKADQNFYHAGRDVFLENYFGGELPAWHEDLPFFTAGALFLHLDGLLERAEEKWEPKIDALLEQCEQALG